MLVGMFPLKWASEVAMSPKLLSSTELDFRRLAAQHRKAALEWAAWMLKTSVSVVWCQVVRVRGLMVHLLLWRARGGSEAWLTVGQAGIYHRWLQTPPAGRLK